MSDEFPPEGVKFEGELYEIRIQGHLHPRWTERFEGLTITQESDGTTRFFGSLPDQTALHGILLQIRNMNLEIISVNQFRKPKLDQHSVTASHESDTLKATCQRFHEEARNMGNLNKWKELVSPLYIEHLYPLGDLDIYAAIDFSIKMQAAFSKRTVAIEEILVEGDTVVMQWSTSGVHTGEIFGISPTGLEVKTSGCSIFRLEGSRIAESYVYEDWLGFFQQMGVVPCFTVG